MPVPVGHVEDSACDALFGYEVVEHAQTLIQLAGTVCYIENAEIFINEDGV